MSGLGKWLRGLFARREIPDIPPEWLAAGGEGVRVCVIDTGLPDHRDLAGALDVDGSRSFVWGEDVYDRQGHATAVCGVLHRWAPGARITCYKAAREAHGGAPGDLRAALEAAARGGFDVVSVSLALDAGASHMNHALGVLESLGVPVVCGAGNDPSKVRYPARLAGAIAVGACDSRGRPARFSPSGNGVDCLFPGVGVRTLWLHGGTATESGTSMAAPCAAAVAALYISHLRRHVGDGLPRGADLVAATRRALAEVSA